MFNLSSQQLPKEFWVGGGYKQLQSILVNKATNDKENNEDKDCSDVNRKILFQVQMQQ